MNFLLIKIAPESSIGMSAEYACVVNLNGGRRVSDCLVSEDGSVLFFTLSVEMNQDRPPGEYVMIVNGNLIKVFAYRQIGKDSDMNCVVTYLIDSIEFDERYEMDKSSALEILHDAFGAEAQGYPVKPNKVNLEFLP